MPLRLEPPSGGALLVRSRVEAGAMMNAVRREVQAVDPDQPVFTVLTYAQMQANTTAPFRVFGTLFAVFALITADYSYGTKTVTVRTTIDMRPYRDAMRLSDPIVTELGNMREKELPKIASELAKLNARAEA